MLLAPVIVHDVIAKHLAQLVIGLGPVGAERVEQRDVAALDAGGFQFGETDEMGFAGVKDKVHVHDLQATIMHLLGFDHERLTYRFQGRDYRLTDVHGHVVKEILA